jgi:hypothetical protein
MRHQGPNADTTFTHVNTNPRHMFTSFASEYPNANRLQPQGLTNNEYACM